MSIAATLWQRRDELVQSLHEATIYGILKTWQRCDLLSTAPQEPDFVAGLVTESTPLIHSVLSSVLSPQGISVSVCGVFCHQTPQVTFGSRSSASCELGDLLFAYVHTPRVGQPRRNAILFQAKASSQQPYHIHGGEVSQLRLYRDWPDFEYTRSSFLNGQKRSVTPKTPHPGAQYLLIDDRPPNDPMSGLLGVPGTYPVGCCIPDELLCDHIPLADELFNLFVFRTGRPFGDRAAAVKAHDWSQVVWDLLNAGMKKAFTRRNSGRHRVPRFAGDTVEMLDGVTFAQTSSRLCCSTAYDVLGRGQARVVYEGGADPPPEVISNVDGFDEPESGVSVILIETSERESEG